MKKRRPGIFVAGASNIDLISYVTRLPRWGETLHGSRFHIGYGGKGANQAVMAAKLGGDVKILTKLGNDIFGKNTQENFELMGVDTKWVLFTDKAFSGVAPIIVNEKGQNAIIIVTGANDYLTLEEIHRAREDISEADVVVCQLEIPVEMSLEVLKIAYEAGVTTVFNPAPARPELPEELYQYSDIICPNEREAEMLTKLSIKTLEDAERAGKVLLDRGVDTVILTLGERGSLLMDKNGAFHIPSAKVKAIDTTGAGDAFVGSLAFFLAMGKPIKEAIRRANYIAAISVQSSGTQVSFPRADELPDDIIK